MPAAVGVDIGCGMVAVRTQFTVADMRKRSDLASLRMAIENAIPLSAGKYDEAVCEAPETAARIAELEESDGAEAAGHVAPNWRLQLGSLGSGNHFIEVSLDEQDRVWLFLHSGSRRVGNRLASKHIKTAVARSGGSACPIQIWPTWWRTLTSSAPTYATYGGHSTLPC